MNQVAQASIQTTHMPPSHQASSVDVSAALHQAVQAASRRIAPTWPLDRSIAVNPWWGFVDQPIQVAAASIGRLCGSPLTMPVDWFLTQYDNGVITEDALREALKRHDLSIGIESFKRTSSANAKERARLKLFTDVLDAKRDLQRQPACKDVVTHAIGQHCASWFDQGQARWKPNHATSLYAAWREIASHDNGPSLLTGISGIAACIAALPEQHDELIRFACQKLKIGQDEYEAYFSALLLSVNGWAAWCAYLHWQAGQQGGLDNHLEQLLAIRLAWEWVLADAADDEALLSEWSALRRTQNHANDTSSAWVWQDALEISWQNQVNKNLLISTDQSLKQNQKQTERPAMQAIFCIDVRSEPMRRALEASNSAITTHGFADFFGLPIEYLPFAGQCARPQLPGLLAPKYRAVSTADDVTITQNMIEKKRSRLSVAQAWDNFRTSASSGFGFVETTGLSYAWKLLRASLHNHSAANTDAEGLQASECEQLHPVIEGITLQESIDLAAGVLRAMSMHDGFAPLVLLVGHGSQSKNNPHAAGLDCGACCGQTGEVNARVLARLLNQVEVRAGLRTKGIKLPEDTRFIAGLHNTTTDEISLFDIHGTEASHPAALAQTREWLLQASQRIRAERAPCLGLAQHESHSLADALRQRANDWSQVRPEWGLANNAAFIAAPRNRTLHMNLQGRSFLHDYYCEKDADNSVLELILTAPVVVAHWINMQYYASTVDNHRWGSGNKVLHNVVGGNIGVFEGNGGDLRIGLPLQSLHDGENWVHTPLRLSVWVEAPREAISSIINRHEKLSQLVHGGWLHLFCIDPSSGAVLRFTTHGDGKSTWVPEYLFV